MLQQKLSSALRTSALALAIFAIAATSAQAQIFERLRQRMEGFDPERLGRLGAQMENAVKKGYMAGGRGIIFRDGDIIYDETWGVDNIATSKPIDDDTIFRIYSMTKPVTSVAVMMLYEEGKLGLDVPIGAYIPELANLKVWTPQGTRKATRQPTVRDVLMHTGGFTYGFFGATPVDRLYMAKQWENRVDIPLQMLISELGEIPLLFEPGERWHYSVSTDVLGRLVEVVSGQSLAEYFAEHIFEPLEMEDTNFRIPRGKEDRVAVLYSPEGVPAQWMRGGFFSRPTGAGLEVAHPQLNTQFQADARLELGGSGLMSTVDDYMRFAEMLLNGGELDGVRLLSPQTVSLMTSDGLGDTHRPPSPAGFPKGVGFGLGFGVMLDRGLAGETLPNGSFFWGGAAGTTFWVDPENEIIGLFMMQSLPNRGNVRDLFRRMVYQAYVDDDDDRRDD